MQKRALSRFCLRRVRLGPGYAGPARCRSMRSCFSWHSNTRQLLMANPVESVLRLVAEPDYKPMTLKAMSRRFHVSTDDYAEFRALVKSLIKEGKLELARDKTLRKPDHSGAIIGLFRRTSQGFGFVRPHTSTARA